jgi:hypothetical protein
MISLTVVALAAFAIPALGQEEATTPVQGGSYVDDWSHHHLVFSNPGTEQDAIKNGTHERWLKITNDPRYQMQIKKRSMGTLPVTSDPNLVTADPNLATENVNAVGRAPERPIAPTRPHPILGNGIKKDWSMNDGVPLPSLTITVNAPSGSNVTGGTSTITVDSETFTASAPVAASSTGTFSANPTNGGTLKITNGANSQILTASYGTAGTQTGTFGSVPTEATAHAGDSITIANGANTLSVTTNATGASLGGTWTNDPTTGETAPTVTISGVTTTLSIASGAQTPSATAAFSGVPTANQTVIIPSGIQTMTLTAAAPTGSTNGIIQVNTGTPTATDTLTLTTATFGTVTYTFSTTACGTTANCIYEGTSVHNMAENIEAAINANTGECGHTTGGACFGSNTVVNPYVVAGAPAVCNTTDYCISLTNDSYQAVTLGKTGTSGDFTLTNATAPTNTGCSANTATATTGNFIIGTGALGSAENLYGAINACNTTYPVIGTSASSFTASTDSFTISEAVYGALESSFTENLSNFTLTSVQAGNLGSANSCSKVSGTAYTANYEAASTAAGLATNVVAALQACPAAGGNIYALTGAGAAFTVYNNQLGTAASTISTEAAGTPSLVTWGSAAAGSAGSNTCNSTTAATFQVSSGDTTTNNATNLAAALNACATGNDATIGIATGASAPHATSSGAVVTIVANQWVANPGLTLGATASGPFSWTAASITNGVNGSSVFPNFAVDNILADDAANLVADINHYTGTVGVSATNPTGAQVTISASTPGTGGNSITLTNGLSNITLASLAGGTNGGGDTASLFNYWSGSNYESADQLASDLYNAFEANSTLTGAFTISNPSGTSNTITLTAKASGSYTAGANGNPGTLVTFSNGGFSGGTGAVNANTFPAKFSFATTNTPTCSDYVVYPTGGTGATLIAYNNIYTGTCTTGNVPNVAWAYNTGNGGAVTSVLSPALSIDGTQVAYIQTNSSNQAELVVLKPSPGTNNGTAGSPAAATYVSNSSYRACTAPCYTIIPFGNSANDTNSSPYYVYGSLDTLYVGDNSGQLHEFTGVFNGTPGEVTGGNWPIAVGSSSDILTDPVYDPVSGNIFVADSGGYLYSYSASTALEVMKSSQLTNSGATTGIVDGPLLDSSTEEVYVFVGDDSNTASGSINYTCANATGCNGVFQFAAGNTTTGTGACVAGSNTTWSTGTNCGVEAVFGKATTTTLKIYDGTFDHIYEVGTGGTGNLWACSANASSEPRLSYVTIQNNGSIVPSGDVISANQTGTNVFTPITGLTSAAASCSPVTEFWGSGGGNTDYIYAAVTASGTETGCSGACLYNFVVATGGTATTAGTLSAPSNATAGIASAGGASGIIVDNLSTAAGGSQVYYSNLAAQSCSGTAATGSGTGSCAVQTSQTAP